MSNINVGIQIKSDKQYFDEQEVNVLRNNSYINFDFVEGFFLYYTSDKECWKTIFNDKYDKLKIPIKIKNRRITKEDESLLEDYKQQVTANIKIEIINLDIDYKIPRDLDYLVKRLKGLFNIGNKNIDLIGYKFTNELKKYNEDKMFHGKKILIDMAKSLSSIFEDRESYLKFEKLCYETFKKEEIEIINNNLEKSKEAKILKKAENNVIFQYFPEKMKYNFDDLSQKMNKYIKAGTPEIYQYIIENKRYPLNNFWQPLFMISESKSDIVRFADCFEIELKEASIIFGTPVESKNRVKSARTEFYYLLKSYNPKLYLEIKEA